MTFNFSRLIRSAVCAALAVVLSLVSFQTIVESGMSRTIATHIQT